MQGRAAEAERARQLTPPFCGGKCVCVRAVVDSLPLDGRQVVAIIFLVRLSPVPRESHVPRARCVRTLESCVVIVVVER